MWKFALFIGFVVLAFFSGNYFFKPDPCSAGCGKKLSSVSAREFVDLYNQGGRTVIDVRTQDEYSQGHIPGAINADFNNESAFLSFLEGLDKKKSYSIYCRSGNRSGRALKQMESLGFTDVVNLEGGIVSLQNSGLELVK